MNRGKKFIATILCMAMVLVAGVGGVTVFAEEEKDVQVLVDDGTASTNMIVSGCDLKADKLVTEKVKSYGFSMLVPQGSVTSLDTPKENFDKVGYTRPYFIEQGCVFQTFTSNENYCAVSLFVEDLKSVFNYYGDYSKLSKEQQEELIESAKDDSETAEFVKINGKTYLESYTSDSSEGNVYAQYKFDTVINGVKYSIYIQTLNATQADNEVINTMIKSIKLRGMTNAPSTVEIVLMVAVVLLIAAVALAYFFLFRINEFMNSGAEEFALIGFDLPKSEADDEFEDDDDDDDDDDETVEKIVEEAVEETEEASDDEKIIED